jgi:hypothetical protein
MTNRKHFKACVFIEHGGDVSSMLKLLESLDINAEVFSEPDSAVLKHKKEAFDLIIAEDDPKTGKGLKLINDFVTINWMTSSVPISDLDEVSIHDRTEGLGILGHMSHLADLISLKSLMDKFKKFHQVQS